jgi:hypothetical protein
MPVLIFSTQLNNFNISYEAYYGVSAIESSLQVRLGLLVRLTMGLQSALDISPSPFLFLISQSFLCEASS